MITISDKGRDFNGNKLRSEYFTIDILVLYKNGIYLAEIYSHDIIQLCDLNHNLKKFAPIKKVSLISCNSDY